MPFEWWKTLIKEVSVNGENCLRNYNNTGCKKCIKECTVKAISPNTDGIEVDHGKCNLCGACSGACPTEAIPITFEPYGFLKDRDFIYLCPKSLGQDYSYCLGWMSTEHVLFKASGSEVERVIISPGNCGDCIPGIDKILRKKVRLSRQFINNFSKRKDIIYRPQSDGLLERSEVITFFKEKTLENLKEQFSKTLPGKIYFRKKRLLLSALKNLGEVKDDKIKAAISTWSEVEVEKERCDYCGICSKLCPSKALFTHLDDEKEYLLQKPSKCFKCGLCKKICPQEAISYKSFNSIKTFVEEKNNFLIRGKSKRCLSCNSMFLDRDKETLCTNCKKSAEVKEDIRGMLESISK
jgi:ferredoxin